MRVTLQMSDMTEILSSYLGRPVDHASITIRTDPFEVEIAGLDGAVLQKALVPPKQSLPQQMATLLQKDAAVRHYDAGHSRTVLDGEERDLSESESAGTPMTALLNYSRDIERELNRTKGR